MWRATALTATTAGLFIPFASAAAQLPAPGAFTVMGTNGYSIFVGGLSARGGKPASVLIYVSSKRNSVAYSAPATVTETSIQADLGALGEIDVEFRPSGAARTMRPVCDGQTLSFDSGHYEGTIAFHGEKGYTAVETSRGRGDVSFFLDFACPGSSGTGVSGPDGEDFYPGAELVASATRVQERAHLKVVNNHPASRVHYEVSVSEMRGRISILRMATLVLPPDTFLYDPDVRIAAVRPPAPFAGIAHFERGAGPTNRWSGDLTVDLPGRSGVRLTGGEERTTLMHARWDWSPKGHDGGHSSHRSSLTLGEHPPAPARGG